MSAKSNKTTWHSEEMPRLEKFSENALKASSLRNRTLEGEGSVEEEASEQRGFRVGVDLRLGAIDTTNVNRFRGRKRRRTIKKVPRNSNISNIWKGEYVCMGNA